MRVYKTIGILGGQGPAATAHMYCRLVKAAQDSHRASQDQDFPPTVIWSKPLPDFDEKGFTDIDSPLLRQQLLEAGDSLVQAGCEILLSACNTLSYLARPLRSSLSVRYISPVEAAAKEISRTGARSAGILCSQSTKDLGIYDKALDGTGIAPISSTAEEQHVINKIILAVMSGTASSDDIHRLKRIARAMRERGADTVVVGCTELSVLAEHLSDLSVPVIDSVESGVSLALNEARAARPARSKPV